MKKALFLYLTSFSRTGGIEKYNRAFQKALLDFSNDGILDARSYSLYDSLPEERYFPKCFFKGFSGNKFWFLLSSILYSSKFDTVILGHLNLAPLGYCIKKVFPSVRLIIIVHGIEAWNKHRGLKLKILDQADIIFSVSEFTKSKIKENHPEIDQSKIKIIPNTIDPFFSLPVAFEKPLYLQEKYRLKAGDRILLTTARMSSSEKYKGYDTVIKVMERLKSEAGNLKYFICGKADNLEKERILGLINQKGLSDRIFLTGFIKEEELLNYFLLADIFIMPSKNEGFGIVFIEAVACGRKVIAGNRDGSVEALQNGLLGQLVDPESVGDLVVAVRTALQSEVSPIALQQKVLEAFGFDKYKERIRAHLFSL